MKKIKWASIVFLASALVFLGTQSAVAVSQSSTEDSNPSTLFSTEETSDTGSSVSESKSSDSQEGGETADSTTASSETENSDEEIITEESNKAMGSNIKEIYQDEQTLNRLRANIDNITAGESNRPSANFIDVSSHNGTISVSTYQKLKTYGINGVVVKATEGTTYTNPYAKSQISNALAAGFKVSVYHYSHYTTAAIAKNEANYFASVVNSLGVGKSVNMVIDIEEPKMQNSSLNGNTSTFKNTLNSAGYGKVYYYMSKSWLSTSGQGGSVFSVPTFGAKNIWVAQYPYSPSASQNWNSDNAAWQWSSRYYVPGVSHPFDINKDYTWTFSSAGTNTSNTATYHYKNSLTGGYADFAVSYGTTSDEVYFGDWDGDGIDTPVTRKGNTFYFKNTNSAGGSEFSMVYGRVGDQVYIGDWNGDGKDTLAVRQGAHYYFRNSLTSGYSEFDVWYGRAGDKTYVGDWNGDGKDSLVVRQGAHYYFRNSLTSGYSESDVWYGRANDDVYVGDWNGDKKDTLVVRQGSVYHFRNSLTSGYADFAVWYGRADDKVYFGDWNKDNIDTFVVRK